jgi:hypothetical protein
MIAKLSLTLGTLLLVSGCTVYTTEEPRSAPARYDEPPPRAQRPPTRAPQQQNQSWQKLGEGVANGKNDRDVVPVGASEGTFRAIRLKVERSSVRMNDLIVHFTDGTKYSPSTPTVIQEGYTNTIDLPGSRRGIRSVEFRYSDTVGGGPSRVEIWGI